MQSLGVDLPEKDFVMRYYRERALPHLDTLSQFAVFPRLWTRSPKGWTNGTREAPLTN